jgi:integral membrane protein
MNISLKAFRLISIFEGLSFLILLGIAMPLKYLFDIPEAVQTTGMAHGLLFILYIFGAFFMKQKLNWSFQTLLIVILCSVLPFGPFYADRKYLKC